MWIEVPVCIHGITPQAEPTSHDGWFGQLLANVNAELRARGKDPLGDDVVRVEWGWEGSEGKDHALAEAERALAACLETNGALSANSRNPVKRLYGEMRSYFIFGFADLFYYVSEEGRAAVWENVFGGITRQLAEIEGRKGEKAKLSLTFFAHSAGSIVAHDFLYHLFDPRGGFLGFGLNDVRKMARRGRLRVRRVYTMGSPIAPSLFRGQALVDKVKTGEKLNPEHIGLKAGDALGVPRWVNFWDYDDVFSYPIAYLYAPSAEGPVLTDVRVELGGFFPQVHRRYAESREVAAAIAATF